MKAIIIDYRDASILRITIPKGWEEDAAEFVESLPCYHNDCYFIVTDNDTFEVYDIVQDGEDAEGCPNYDYQKATEL